MNNKLSVAFLWHMHQPLYKDLITGKYYLPWVRLHSTYSYLDMVSVLDEFPEIKVTFNFTPSLMLQLKDIAANADIDDVYLSLSLKDAADLDDKDKSFVLKNFFSCDVQNAIFPFKRYKELFSRRGDDLRREELIRKTRDFSAQDFRDIQVFFNLAWCGFTLKEEDALVRELVNKSSNYTEDEKRELLELQNKTVSGILPAYKRLQDAGRIEISTSPFYHPILPLLCGARPEKGFDFSEDAENQIKKAVLFYEKVFGKKPIGMWPSEGSVSRDIIPLLVKYGIKWIATDEGILLESFKDAHIPREKLIYNAFTATAKEKREEINMVFRDINLSNAISFRYAHMPAQKAVLEFMRDISGIQSFVIENKIHNPVTAVILDGENPWPYYKDGGKEFLSELYRKLSSKREQGIVCSTIGESLALSREKKEITNLFSGSWIDRNFNKWIGSPQKNKAWEYLEKARRELFQDGIPHEKALEELYIAEGSDWFWWYDDFGTELNFVFDELFRLHLSNIYSLMGRKIPYYLLEPMTTRVSIRSLSRINLSALEMAQSQKIAMVSSEAVPFAKTGGLADVIGSLPKALISLGADVRVIMPFYKCIKSGESGIVKEAGGIYSCRTEGITFYFLENKRYFERDSLYGTREGDYPDNGLRFAFFSKAALLALKELNFKPDVIHCNDWQTALMPFYLKFVFKDDGFYQGIKTLFTIHNMEYQGIFSRNLMKKIDIPENFFRMDALEFYGKLNFMKSGILYSDAVSTVSSCYAEEIMTPEYGAGLDGLLRARKDNIYGIPNGADYNVWSPERDTFIKVNYDVNTIEKKKECKKDLLECAKLAISPETPLFGIVSRLSVQKGMDIASGVMERLVDMGAGVVVLGKGEDVYAAKFSELARKYPRNVFFCNGFNEKLAHKIEAGCDIFIMPSRYEPCGLNQIYSIKYGTIPIVRATGGLDDVVSDFDEDRETGNGFKFGHAEQNALYEAAKRAVDLYKDKPLWKKLMIQAMNYDFSWESSAKQYLWLYRKI